MAFDSTAPTGRLSAAHWRKTLAAYRGPQLSRSLAEIAWTVLPLSGFALAATLLVANGIWLGLVLTIPAAAFLVRMFMLQHDCGHGSLFASREVNDAVGRVLGVLTLTPYGYWQSSHANHHGTSGNLDRRELGAIELMTVEEYKSRSPLGRFLYRFYRHPLVLFAIGPAYMFFLQHRLPIGMMADRKAWISVMGANLGIAAVIAAGIAVFGAVPFLAVYGATVFLAAAAGVWLFYVQHQFEQTSWARKETWNLHDAALHGSSFYDLPRPLAWLTANIGVHHIHHLHSRIPFYRLGDALKDYPELRGYSRLGLRESLGCARLTLWDETAGRMVGFRELARAA
ncbi:fatty acid desaturase [Phenylobacterium sp.]|uniref:fatty acid desaturase n=1 Tax=Phenylobacterium sp. TaxID=1871053 RepID=UPI0027319CBF|nr:fatty acid desaturase [Phenylobacterium sp.]MDP1875292.1 fatty acid desaturase [Phenylobacterium sp.]MDP3299509.1 fatty acid desaturase [Phenylobacterium sp.]